MAILAWLGLAPGRPDDPADALVGRIAARLEETDRERARHLALFAYLLARVADVDLEVGEAETREMERLAETHGRLGPAQACLVVELARAENEARGPTHDFLAARAFRDLADEEEKRSLLHCLFAVAASDGSISGREEEEIRTISRALLLPDADYLAIRHLWRDKRSVRRS